MNLRPSIGLVSTGRVPIRVEHRALWDYTVHITMVWPFGLQLGVYLGTNLNPVGVSGPTFNTTGTVEYLPMTWIPSDASA